MCKCFSRFINGCEKCSRYCWCIWISFSITAFGMFFGNISEWKSKSSQLVLFNDIAVIVQYFPFRLKKSVMKKVNPSFTLNLKLKLYSKLNLRLFQSPCHLEINFSFISFKFLIVNLLLKWFSFIFYSKICFEHVGYKSRHQPRAQSLYKFLWVMLTTWIFLDLTLHTTHGPLRPITHSDHSSSIPHWVFVWCERSCLDFYGEVQCLHSFAAKPEYK